MKVTLDDVKLQVILNLKYAKLQYKKDREVADDCYRAIQAIISLTGKNKAEKIRKILDKYNVAQYVNNPTFKMIESLE